jgi:hypothetical protein
VRHLIDHYTSCLKLGNPAGSGQPIRHTRFLHELETINWHVRHHIAGWPGVWPRDDQINHGTTLGIPKAYLVHLHSGADGHWNFADRHGIARGEQRNRVGWNQQLKGPPLSLHVSHQANGAQFAATEKHTPIRSRQCSGTGRSIMLSVAVSIAGRCPASRRRACTSAAVHTVAVLTTGTGWRPGERRAISCSSLATLLQTITQSTPAVGQGREPHCTSAQRPHRHPRSGWTL